MTDAIDFSGREVGRYQLLSLLGSGGMGAVYDAVDSLLGRHVAVKVLPPHLVSDPQRVRRFVQEARTASALNHPHLISIYDIGRQQVDGLDVQFAPFGAFRQRCGEVPACRGYRTTAAW